MEIKISQSGLLIGDRTVPLLSGDIHYWRLSTAVWEECLLKMKDLGFEILCTYVPWSVHEVEKGKFDFGESAPEKNVAAFLRLAHKHGFLVMIRPGPHINAELTDFGFPKRVLDNPNIRAAGPEGEPIYLPAAPKAFPVPSYCSEPFWSEIAVWFDAFAEILRPQLYPDGPVILVQCDNEMSYFFRTGAYDQDYSDGALSAYRKFLEEKYQECSELSRAYGTPVKSWREAMPPTAFRASSAVDIPYYLDWMDFRERVIHDSLVRIRDMWVERGIHDVLFTHNLPTGLTRTPFNIPKTEGVLDIVGQDFYPRRKDYPSFKKKLLMLEGQSRFPWSPEFGSGCYHLWPPVSLDDQKFTTMAALMYGLKGFNFYMIVERERWYGSPITRKGGLRTDYYDFYRDLIGLIRGQNLFEFERTAPALILTPRDYDRLEKAATLFGNLSPMLVEDFLGPEALCDERALGLGHCVSIAHDRMERVFADGLEASGIPYRLGDSESLLPLLRRHQYVFCSSFDFMGEELQKDLASYLNLGGTVILGPEVPSRGNDFREMALLDDFTTRPIHKLDCAVDALVFNAGAGRLILLTSVPDPGGAEAADCMTKILQFLRIEPPFPVSTPCERTVFRSSDRTLIYIANPTGDLTHAGVRVQGTMRLLDLQTGEEFYGTSRVQLTMPPWHVRVLEVCPC